MNLDEEFLTYLTYIGLDIKAMPLDQIKYTRKMFYYSIGYFFEKIVDEIPKMTNEQSVEMFDSIRNQVLDFMYKVLNEYN